MGKNERIMGTMWRVQLPPRTAIVASSVIAAAREGE